MKVIFCDVDGVLNNPGCYAHMSGSRTPADPRCVAALNRITEETAACIVVSSTWRLGDTGLMFCREKFREWGVEAPVVDVTPVLRDSRGHWQNSKRGYEIGAWLTENAEDREVDSFVILDDDADMGGHMHRLVQTNGAIGLTMADAERAIAMLSGVPAGQADGRKA